MMARASGGSGGTVSRHAPSPSSRRHPAAQGGFTLVEAVVSVALVSLVVLGLAAGLLAAVRSSASAKETQQTDNALSAYAESFKSSYPSGVPAGGCPGAGDFSGSVPTDPPGTTGFVWKLEHWNRTSRAWEPACPGGGSDVQRLTVEVDAGYGPKTAQVVVRKP